ncbi:STAS domain-containing protein [Flavobacterium jejuense]|uniref:STAS domain-containing protein n=1 Tax=Flavobacterium jejuense TaxID=1544455 RepID=A0ABX0ISV7_9FLAO|nr:STAS domain-containing protein [Flavobacterium jejuense]NHN26613.1 STAS domain-containing protein [Flavobacterium jejuense]
MALQINENAGVLEINGVLNTQNVNSLKNYFEALISQSSFIIISLNKVIDMDKSSFDTIINLYKKALSKNKVFYIISEGNQKVLDLFQSEKMNYLLKNRAA